MYDIRLSYKHITESFHNINDALTWMNYHDNLDSLACVECEYIVAWDVEIPASTDNLEAIAEIIREYPADLLEPCFKLMGYLEGFYTFDETFFILENNCKIISDSTIDNGIALSDGRTLMIIEPID